ncbi:alkaline phosphatase [Actinoalloteichus caeruleus]|uniref:Alkaline phosphatase n=1 Tax=Actinoalloteichus caeruleus DSM 43889 TaxID=1120930 RepID=A0ABT1JDZ9_ACTCY|nr:alkaline phosphatase [Actinoalloteichus caeruleus]MCP2330729.1 alkaline phosphatase [Actinoalloteichus caeruleus DSM 43889]
MTEKAGRQRWRRPASVAAASALALTIGAPTAVGLEPGTAEHVAPLGFGPKNVIHLISDGMGYNHVDVASLWEHGTTAHQVRVDPDSGTTEHLPATPAQVYEDWPVQLGMSTYHDGHSYEADRAWAGFDYPSEDFTDSSAAGTALATGVRTYNGAIGLAPDRGPVKNLTERAQELGKASGVVSSVPFSHATPAAYVAHNPDRNDYHGIAKEMLFEHDINVVFGPGHPDFDEDGQRRDEPDHRYVDEWTWGAVQRGATAFDLVETPEEFAALAQSSNPPRHVLGVPQVAATLQYDRGGPDRTPDGRPVPGALPYTAPPVENVPTLADMTTSALAVLENASDEGLFLMIEGGAVDWASHDNDTARVIEEQIDFNRAVEAVVDWVEESSSWHETLVVVTADHETGYLAGPGADPTWTPVIGSAGQLPHVSWHSGNHTNALVPLFAKGPGASRLEQHADNIDPVRGQYLNNTDVAKVVFDFWGR